MSLDLPQRRLTVPATVDEEEFFTTEDGTPTLVTHADLEDAVPNREKPFLKEYDRYWVNKPYAFVVIYENRKDNEYRYVAVEPRLTNLEQELLAFLRDKLRDAFEYGNIDVNASTADRSKIVRNKTLDLMKTYNLRGSGQSGADGLTDRIQERIIDFSEEYFGISDEDASRQQQLETRGEVVTGQQLSQGQVRRILYYLVRDFIRFERIDPITKDINVEDISCNGYNSKVFVYQTDVGENMPTNIKFGEQSLDNFIKSISQEAGQGISRKNPRVDATLANGARAQLTLGEEVSDKGSNFTIRQSIDIPFTPVDLINWQTISLDMMAYLWLMMENEKSGVFAGGTASGKTTSLNALSLFLPSTKKVVSIEDTRELEIPHKNWTASTTRESFQEDGTGDIEEFDLIRDALRQRPEYIVMGEVRGEEGQELFQAASTGHTSYTTFHADNPEEVIRRFTTDPINVEESMFEALDFMCQQENIQVDGDSVRRMTQITEITGYSSTKNEFQAQTPFARDPQTDEFVRRSKSDKMEEIRKERGWSQADLDRELRFRKLVLAYMVKNDINSYKAVAATIQGFINSPETVLGLIADNKLGEQVNELTQMENIEIDIDESEEALVPRPSTPKSVAEEAQEAINDCHTLLAGYDADDLIYGDKVRDAVESADPDAILEPDSGKQPLPKDGDGPSAGQEPPDDPEEIIDARLDELFPAEDDKSVVTSEDLPDGPSFPSLVGEDEQEEADPTPSAGPDPEPTGANQGGGKETSIGDGDGDVDDEITEENLDPKAHAEADIQELPNEESMVTDAAGDTEATDEHEADSNDDEAPSLNISEDDIDRITQQTGPVAQGGRVSSGGDPNGSATDEASGDSDSSNGSEDEEEFTSSEIPSDGQSTSESPPSEDLSVDPLDETSGDNGGAFAAGDGGLAWDDDDWETADKSNDDIEMTENSVDVDSDSDSSSDDDDEDSSDEFLFSTPSAGEGQGSGDAESSSESGDD